MCRFQIFSIRFFSIFWSGAKNVIHFRIRTIFFIQILKIGLKILANQWIFKFFNFQNALFTKNNTNFRCNLIFKFLNCSSILRIGQIFLFDFLFRLIFLIRSTESIWKIKLLQFLIWNWKCLVARNATRLHST